MLKDSKPTIYDPQFMPTSIYGGVPTFMNLPVIERPDQLSQVDVAFMGVPWEGGCTIGRFSSCTDGPKSIREASLRYTGFLPEFDLDCYDYLKAADYGDTAVKNGDYDFTFGEIRKKIADILDAGAMPFTLGGDHGITLPIVEEMAKRHPKRVGIIHFDAHLDNYDGYGDDIYARCSPFYRLYQDPNMDPTKIVHLGIRGPRNHKKELQNAKDHGATVITAMEVRENGWKAAITKALEVAAKDVDELYISICSDCLDAAFMPQGPQDMGGLTSYDMLMMLRECGKAGATGFDFVEIYPDAFSLQTASHVGCWFALYLLNGIAERKKNENK